MSENLNRKKIKVWDISTRLFHWVLVILFCMSAYSAFENKFGIYGDMHLYSGIAVLVLVTWRILWGLIGSETARFKNFVRGPKHMKAYLELKADDQHAGHNPIGGVSVMIALMLLLAQALLGLYSTDDILFSGPFAHSINNAGDVTDIHEILGYTLIGWVALHVLAVVYHRLVMKADLVTPMITGMKMVHNMVAAPVMGSPLLSVACLMVAGGSILWWIFG